MCGIRWNSVLEEAVAQKIANSLWAMGNTGTLMPGVFKVPCRRPAGADPNKQHVAYTLELWAMGNTGT